MPKSKGSVAFISTGWFGTFNSANQTAQNDCHLTDFKRIRTALTDRVATSTITNEGFVRPAD
jgi:hypothetical protein